MSSSNRRQSRVNRRVILQASAAAAGSTMLAGHANVAAYQEATPVQTQRIGSFDLLDVTIAELRTALDAGDITVRELVQACLDQIAALDQSGPALNAILELSDRALDDADALDAELADTGARGPLHGIPVILKDNIATTDGMENTAGSLALEGALPTQEAFVVGRLRDSGAVILGKAGLSEWANIRSPRSTSGWSGRGGQVLNPHQTDRSPSGSSSGSAVAVAAGYVPVALGTETDGSLVSPANVNGVVTIKPTVGLTSRMGVIPISTHQDTVGPLARNVADAAATLTVIAAQDRSDPAYSSQEFQASSGSGDVLATPVGAVEQPTYPRRPNDRIVESDFAAAEILNPDGLQGARLGVWRERTGYSTETDAIFEQALSALQDAGAELIDPVTMPSAEELATSPDELQVLLWELNPGIADYIENYVDADFPIRNLADVVAFNKEHPDEELLWFGQEFLIQSVDKSSLDDKDYLETVVRTQKRGRENGIDAVLSEHNLDAIIAPTGQLAWKIDLIAGDNFKGASSSAAAVAGYPIVSVPAGSQFGLPANISFIGTAFSEAVLIRLAFAFEQATQARITPAFLAPRVIPPVT